jgi:hypothetical protein
MLPCRRSPSELRAAEWAGPAAPIPAVKPGGCPASWSRWEAVNAIRSAVCHGYCWRVLRHDRPPWRTVGYFVRQRRREGVLATATTGLRERERGRQGVPGGMFKSSVMGTRNGVHLVTGSENKNWMPPSDCMTDAAPTWCYRPTSMMSFSKIG